ncbi:MAG: anti-sigma factor [Melioribacteraceae bacterium]|nr:anti-sigma factor [Melioribacteraceae bacterium]
MADKIIHEMISAFAAGCIDKENFIQFKDYVKAGGELPEGELGELQNIVAMIPIILDLENPDAKLKDTVAKKLIGMKDEFKTKIINERKTALTSTFQSGNVPPVVRPKQNTLTFVSRSKSGTSKEFNFDEDQIKLPVTGTKNFLRMNPPSLGGTGFDKFQESRKVEEEAPVKSPTIDPVTEPISPQKEDSPTIVYKKETPLLSIIALVAAIVTGSISILYTFYSTGKIEKEIQGLKTDYVSLQTKLNSSSDFIKNYSAIIDFFNYEDISTYTFTSIDPLEKASARLLVSFRMKEALLQLKGVKELPSSQKYQLWIFSNGQPYSLGTYTTNNNLYQKSNDFPAIPKEQVESFRITIEQAEGAATPSPNTYLISTVEVPRTGRYR